MGISYMRSTIFFKGNGQMIYGFSLLILLFCGMAQTGYANITVTPGSGGTGICSNLAVGGSAAAYTTLGTITVAEGANNDFGAGGTGNNFLTLTAPAGWQFNNTGTPVLTGTNAAHFTNLTGFFSSTTTYIIFVRMTATVAIDRFTISGLQVQATGSGSAAGNIVATAITGTFTGITLNVTNFGSLSLTPAVTPSVSIAASPVGAVCAGTNVTFTATPVNGGVPTYQWSLNAVIVPGATNTTYSNSGLATGDVVSCQMAATGCLTAPGATSNLITMAVNPLPTIDTMTGGGSYCSGGTGVDVGLNGSSTGVSYQLYYNGAPSGSAVAGTGTSLDFNFQTAAGVYTVMATNTVTACVSNMAGSATITINAVPVAYAVTGGGAYCAGDTGVHIGLANSELGVNYSLYQGATLAGVAVGTTAPLDFGLVTTPGVYNVVASNTTTSCTSNMAGTVTVTINPLPSAITGADSACVNGTSLLSDATGSGVWSSSNTSIATVAAGIVTGVSGGVAVISYTLITGCAATATFTVDGLPAASGITGVPQTCVGSVASLNDAAPGGVWSSSDNTVAPVNPLTGFVAGVSMGTATISYTLTSGSGCTSSVTTGFTVLATPTVNAISGSGSLCAGTSAALSDATPGGAWASSDNTIATIGTGGLVNGLGAGTVVISYTVAGGGGCNVTVTAIETVNSLPVTSAIIGGSTVCAGSTVTLSNSIIGGIWSSSNIGAATISATGVVSGLAPGTTIISYTITSGSGCTTSVMDTLTVGSAMPLFSELPASASLTLCHNHPENLVIYTTGTGISYQWYMNGNPIAGATNSSYIATTTGVFYATASNGSCGSTLPSKTIIATPNPLIAYNAVGHYLYTGSFNTYQWLFNGAIISGANTSVYIPTVTGVYNVVVSDGNGCIDTSAGYNYMGASTLVAHISAGDIRVYPNPVSSFLHIDAPVAVNVTVMSADGRLLIREKNTSEINVDVLAPGIYLVMVYDAENNLLKTERFSKIN